MNGDQVFDLVKEGGEKIDLFSEGAISPDAKQQLDDMYTVLTRFSVDSVSDISGESFGVLDSAGQNYKALGFMPEKQRERIKNSQWFNEIVELKNEDVYTHMPEVPRGEDYNPSAYSINTPKVRVVDLPKWLAGGKVSDLDRSKQQYEVLVRKMTDILDTFNMPYNYKPDTYFHKQSTLDEEKSFPGTSVYKTEMAESTGLSLIELIGIAPGANIDTGSPHIVNRYQDIYKKAENQGLKLGIAPDVLMERGL